MKAQSLLAVASVLTLTACGAASPTTGSIDLGTIGAPATPQLVIPKLTDGIESNSGMALLKAVNAASDIQAMSRSGALPHFYLMRDSSESQLSRVAYIDFRACMAEKIVRHKNSDLSNGDYFYTRLSIGSGSVDSRYRVNAPNGSLQKFELQMCKAGSQVWHFEVNQGSNANAKMKMIEPSFTFEGNAQGVYSNGKWASKAINTKFYSSSVKTEASLQILPGSIRLSEVHVDLNDANMNHQMIIRNTVSGAKAKNFVFGGGSGFFNTETERGGSGAAVFGWYTGDETGIESGGLAIPYGPESATKTMADLPTLQDVAPSFSSNEVWDCSIPAGSTEYDERELINTDLATELQSCVDDYQ